MEWLDKIVKDVASTDVLLFDQRQCIEGHYLGLRVNECRDLISRISGLSEWAAERWSCGTLVQTISGGCGTTTSGAILCGPFQKIY